jgi:hypothetical protein
MVENIFLVGGEKEGGMWGDALAVHGISSGVICSANRHISIRYGPPVHDPTTGQWWWTTFNDDENDN